MDDYISRQAAIEALINATIAYPDGNRILNQTAAINRIQEVPPADVRPAARGKWEIHAYGLDGEDVYCSVCGCGLNLPHWNYCPICGADMRGDDAE